MSPGVAFAQAEALLDEGKSLMKKGKLEEACPKLEESYRLSPRSATLLSLAMCHEKQGKVATAWAEYIDLGAAARKEGNKRLEADAKARGAKLELSLPRLTLSVPRAAAVEGLEVTLDGAPVDGALWGQARPIDPGQHKVSASAPGRKPWERSVSIKRGERKTVAVPALAKDASAAPEPAPAAEAPVPAAEKGIARAGDGAAGAGKGAAGAGKGAAEAGKGAAGAGKGAAGPEKGAAAAAPGKGAAGAEKGAAGPGKAGAGPEEAAAGSETAARPAAPPAAEGPPPSSGAALRHTGSFVIEAGVAGGALIGLMDAGSFGDLSAYSYSYNIPEGELIAPCDDEVCHASFDPAIGPFAGGEAFIGVALSEGLHLGARVLGGYRFGGGYLLVGGPSASMRFGRVWLGLSGLVGGVGQEAKVTGIKGEIPSEVVDLNYGRTEVAVNAREGSLPESALVETLAFGGSVDVSLVLADLPSAGWTSGALLLSVSPTVMKGLDGWVFAAPASLGYRFY
ncbi:tetratricopeptide repeat protein [Sorangium sp. So ce1000]|uniref:tetratricopeptide repeat protein n=1 Tax=Sorangium sp. So ce1000 TaxID=3133325 RepID=UPI003F5ECB56